HQLGAAAARHLARTIRPGETIGTAWGTTLTAMVDAMVPIPTEGSRVVQILGGLGPPDADEYGAVLARRLAQRLDAQVVLLPAPGIVATVDVRDVLRKDPHVRAALNELDTLDTIFVGLGSLASNAVLNDGHTVTRQEKKDLKARRAVCDIAMRFFDAQGNSVRTTLDDRILGITTDQLRKAARVVAVAGGADKVDAIAAALKAGIVHVLITDRSTAEALVARAEGRPVNRRAFLGAVGPQRAVVATAPSVIRVPPGATSSAAVDRRARLARHAPVVTRCDQFSALSVGNGAFAFAADATGLQTFADEYREIPLATQAEWGCIPSRIHPATVWRTRS